MINHLCISVCLSLVALPSFALEILPPDPKPLAIVNGKPISQQQLEMFQKELATEKPVESSVLLEEMIQLELIQQEAHRLGLDQNPRILRKLEFFKIKLLTKEVTNRALSKLTITDGMVQAKYDQLLAKSNMVEYHARHILSENEQDSLTILSQLNSGQSFIELAKQKSTDSSAQSGGDLGWFNASSMSPVFMKVVEKLNKAQYNKQPVKTEYGWHIIYLEDTRKLPAPPVNEVKEEISKILKGKFLESYLAKLRAAADIKIPE
jgi:peptidyl-prolyl cis-trans isomerase C